MSDGLRILSLFLLTAAAAFRRDLQQSDRISALRMERTCAESLGYANAGR